jgi:H+/Cl- antiporter ClcA
MSGPEYLRLVVFGALIGIPAALVATVFLAVVHESEHWFWTTLPSDLGRSSPPWYLILGLPMLGAGIVLFARRMLPGDGGHPPLGGLNSTPTPLAYGPGVALAALGTLPFGAVLGPEAPLIALGSATGLAVVYSVRLPEKEQAVLATAGSFSAISALFGGPIPAGILMVEASIGLGAAAIPVLLPGLVSAAVGFLIFVGVGNWHGIHETTLSVSGLPAYHGTHLLDLVMGVGVGIAVALLLEAVHRFGEWIAGPGLKRLGMAATLIAGGFAVGLVALIADGLGANSQDVLFSGQASLPALIAESSVGILVVLLVGKAIGYAISLGSGFRGGPVFPSIFLGVAIASLTVTLFNVSPTLAVAVGTAAGMAAATRLLFASLIVATLLVGSSAIDTVPATVLAAAAAWLTATTLAKKAEAASAKPAPTAPAG